MDKNVMIAKELVKIAKKLTASSSEGYEVYVHSDQYTVCWSGDLDVFLTSMEGTITISENACNVIAEHVKEQHDMFVGAMKKNGYQYINSDNKLNFHSSNGKVYICMSGSLEDVQNNNAIQQVCDSIGLSVKFEHIWS